MRWLIDDYYSWIVFIHVASTLGFVMAHGISAGALFALRRGGALERTRALLDLSAASFAAVYVSLLALLASGIVAGIMGGHFTGGRWWLWISIALFVVLIGYMGAVRWSQMVNVRHAAGLQTQDDIKKGMPAPEPSSEADIVAAVASVRPWLVLFVGFGGLIVILALMMFKPI